MPDRKIFEATKTNCIEYQRTSSSFAHDAMYFLENGIESAARNAQHHSRKYSDLAQERLSRLIGTA